MNKWWMSTHFLAIGIPVIGGVILLIGLWLLNKIFQGNTPNDYTYLLGAISNISFLFGFWIMIARKELPRIGFPSTKGPIAVVVGVLCFLACSIVEIMLVYSIITE